ncbi:unnamed protein product [Caenorhabditis bovis]|uniref:Small ribosomal subunit protein uS5m n=1 Tax=Caenorhabditis bovis TaxID=2654633 RepID=A0A8S1EEH0_9PELO|nr:unnamed protein product [Caenorhabditis bovis]
MIKKCAILALFLLIGIDCQKKNIIGLTSEDEQELHIKKTQTAGLKLSNDDLDWEQIEEQRAQKKANNVATTFSDEYVPEKASVMSSTSAHEAGMLFTQALSYTEKGKGHGKDGKRAAHRLLELAAQLGHPEAKKITAYGHLFGDYTRWSIEEAKKTFVELESTGSPDAQLGIGFMHATGVGMEKSDQGKAIVYYMFSALGGNPLAQMAMGFRYHSGVGVPQSCESALSYYQKVAKFVADNVRLTTSQAIQRVRLTDENDPTITVQPGTTPLDNNLLEYYRMLADKGDVSSQLGLGQIYLNGGRGVEQNFELAHNYFDAAAKSGNMDAHAQLGKMYLEGTPSTPKDGEIAFGYLLKAADRGSASAQATLGLMYMKGLSVKKNFDKALRLLTLSADKKHVEGQLYLGELYYKGVPTSAGIKRDFKKALKLFQMSSQSGHMLGYYNLAQMHATGTGVARSCTHAVELFKSVAERGKWGERLMEAYSAYKNGRQDEAAMKYLFLAELGYEVAQTNLAYILDRGEATALFPGSRENNLERAFVNWQRSANQEYPVARVKLGDYYYYGLGTEPDFGMAFMNYKTAVDRHAVAQAMFNLGYMHEVGEGISRDLYLAKRFYDQSIEHNADAYFPAKLALAKLAVVFYLEQINKLPLFSFLENTLGSRWDIIAMRTGPELWKTLTSVSKSGQKKGRRNTRQPVRPLNRFYRIGSSPMKVEFAGLNAPIRLKEDQPLVGIVEQTEDEVRENFGSVKRNLEERDTGKKKRNREKLHPMERGFSGTQLVGQKLGPPPPIDGVDFSDFETYCLEVKRTSNMTNVFGRVHTMSALIVTGNGKGLAGYAVGKAPIHRTTTAIINGMNMASKKLFFVELHEDRTIYQDFYAECRNTRVFAQRRPLGYGLVCHPRLIKICEAIGIKDIYVKVEGSTKNYLALTHAFVTGLLNQETHQQLAERKGLHVVEMSPSRHFLPQIVASPISTELKVEDELEALDRLNLDDFYGEGRYPLRKPKALPFFSNLEGHLKARWRKHPFRNHEDVMVRLLADGVVPRWTRDVRAGWAAERHERMVAGVEPIPVGIGLSDIVPKKE